MPFFYIVSAFLFGLVCHHEYVRSRMRRCDACRVEGEGGTRVFIPHTCSKRRALYRSRKGRVTEFGLSKGKQS